MTGRRIRKSFIPGRGYFGAHRFGSAVSSLDGKRKSVVYQEKYNSTSTETYNAVEYAIERGGEYVTKTAAKKR